MKIFLVLYPFKFRLFDEKRFEFDLLKKKRNKVVIFEFIHLLYPHFKKAYKKEKKVQNLFEIKSIIDFIQLLKKVTSMNKQIIVFNFLKNETFKSLIIKIILKFYNFKKVSFYCPGLPLSGQSVMNSKISMYKKISILFERPNETINKIKGKLLLILGKILNIYDDFFFVAGKKYLENLQLPRKKIIKGHTWDISNIWSRKTKKVFKKKYAVYLDAPGPKYLSDSFLFKEKIYETVGHTYPLLKKFFNRLQEELGLDVIVAPHPKTKIKDRSSLFGFRRVISGKTHDLIKNSALVITRNSTAVSIACYYNKPIILFFTNETLNTEAQRYSILLSKSLGLKAINLDNFEDYNLKKLLQFKKKIYKKYLHNFCTFKKLTIPNNKIWTEFNYERQ